MARPVPDLPLPAPKISVMRAIVAGAILLGDFLVLILGSQMRSSEISKFVIVCTLLITAPFLIAFAVAPDRSAGPPPQAGGQGQVPLFRRLFMTILRPGGGQGLLLLLISLAWLLGCHVLHRVFANGPVLYVDTTQLVLLCTYSWIYVALPTSLLACGRRASLPAPVKWVIVVSGTVLSWFFWVFIEEFVGRNAGVVLNPFALIQEVKRNGALVPEARGHLVVLTVVCAISFAGAIPRMLRVRAGH